MGLLCAQKGVNICNSSPREVALYTSCVVGSKLEWSPRICYGDVFWANTVLTATSPSPQKLYLARMRSVKPFLNLAILDFLVLTAAHFSKELNLRFQDADLHDSLSSLRTFIILSRGGVPTSPLSHSHPGPQGPPSSGAVFKNKNKWHPSPKVNYPWHSNSTLGLLPLAVFSLALFNS